MKVESGKINLLGMTLPQLQELCTSEGFPRFTAKQLCDWLYKKRVDSIDSMTNLSLKQRARLNEIAYIGRETPVRCQVSKDGTKKYLFPVLDEQGRFQGMVTLDDVRKIMFQRDNYDSIKMYNIMKSAPAFVYLDEKMESVMDKFESTQAWNLPVLDDENKYLGFVSKSMIFSSYRDQLKAVSDE